MAVERPYPGELRDSASRTMTSTEEMTTTGSAETNGQGADTAYTSSHSPAGIKPNYSDRRRRRRNPIKLNKVFSGRVGEGDDVMPLYIYIVDVSEGGMRITTDFDLPANDPFHLYLKLDDPVPLDMDVEVRWKKPMLGGTCMMGIQFLDLSDEALKVITSFMERHSAENLRRSFRLDQVLKVEICVEGQEETFNTLTMDLSIHGMRITNPFPLPPDRDIELKLFLEEKELPVRMKAQVRWQKETSYERFMIGMEFMDISEEEGKRINNYIEKVISGEINDRVLEELPAELFDNKNENSCEDPGEENLPA